MEETPKQGPRQEEPNNMCKKSNFCFILTIFLLLLLFGIGAYEISNVKNDVKEIKNKIETQKGSVPAPTIPPEPTIGRPTPTSDKTPFDITGTIQYDDLEGGCWFIRVDSPPCRDGKCPLGMAAPYVPIDLPAGLKTIGIKAQFKLEMLSDTAATCQIGPAVKILNYKIVK